MPAAARTVRNASSSWARGRPNTAMIASPMSFLVLPPWRVNSAAIPLKYRSLASRIACESSLSPSAVRSFKSKKIIGTVMRIPRIPRTGRAAATGASAALSQPHKRNLGGFFSPHCGRLTLVARGLAFGTGASKRLLPAR